MFDRMRRRPSESTVALNPDLLEEGRETPIPEVKPAVPVVTPINVSRCFELGKDAHFEISGPDPGRRIVITSVHGSFSARHTGLLSIQIGKQPPMQFHCHTQRDIVLNVEAQEQERVSVTLSFNDDDRSNKSACLTVIGRIEDVEARGP